MPTILIADDSTTIRKVVQGSLGAAGFDVLAAADGREAIRLARERRPDLVLCDVLMPELTGYEVSEAIHADPSTRGIPVLLLCGAFEPFDEARAARSGAVGFFSKPFEPRQLLARVEASLAAAGAGAVPAPPVPRPRTLEVEPIGIEIPPNAGSPAWSEEPVAAELPPSAPTTPEGESPATAWEQAVPLPGDEAFRLPLPGSARGARSAPLETALRDEVRRQVAELAPDLVREVAWEILPDLLERLLREAAAPPPPADPTGDPEP